MNLINRILELEANINLNYIYVFKVEFVNKNKKTKVLYSVGCSEEDPVQKLQEMLLSFYRARGYFPRATVSRCRKSVNAEQITQKLKYELLDNMFSFGSLSFYGSQQFVNVEQKALYQMYDELIPDVSNLRLISKLPKWAYLESELADMSEKSLDENEDYLVVAK